MGLLFWAFGLSPYTPYWGLPPLFYTPILHFHPITPPQTAPPPRPYYGVPLCCGGWREEGDNNEDNESMRLEACEWLHSVKPAKQKSSSAFPNPEVSLNTTGSLSPVITPWCIHTCIWHTYHCTTQIQTSTCIIKCAMCVYLTAIFFNFQYKSINDP